MKKRKTVGIGIVVVIYCLIYLSFRSDHYLIHRKTWANGWNRHWVGNGELIDGPYAFAMMVVVADEKNLEFEEAEEEVMSQIKNAERKQNAAGIIYFPLRVAETLFWYIVDLRA